MFQHLISPKFSGLAAEVVRPRVQAAVGPAVAQAVPAVIASDIVCYKFNKWFFNGSLRMRLNYKIFKKEGKTKVDLFYDR